VDACDFEAANQLLWQYIAPTVGNAGYAKTALYPPELRGKQKSVKLHRLIWELRGMSPVATLDHRNGDGLDCRFQNLRAATPQQQAGNVPVSKNCKCGLKGVRWQPGSNRWTAQIGMNRRSVYLGSFKTKEDAGRAYDRAALAHFGEFARLNFPQDGGK